ncbi:MAG: hypothetical protein K0R85_322 [Devosia sp.]|jgi:hypothetical protein|nr:hypothetical protein [Devosia sp.]
MIIMAATIMPMVALAYWLCFKAKPGIIANVLIVAGVSLLAALWGAIVGATVATVYSTAVVPTLVSGMVAGVTALPLLILAVWMGRKNAREQAALAWKYR